MRRIAFDAPVAALSPVVADVLAGGPCVLPVASARDHLLDDGAGTEGAAFAVATSGSTGDARLVLLPAAALRASAQATADVLGGPGQWLLALPAHHVAGLQVLVRSVLAGTTPVDARGAGAAGFVATTSAMTGARRYVSLVPTQLARLLPEATDALRSFDAVLLGGAATAPDLVARAQDAGVNVVTTYGMTETCGGCVYDGVPLPGVDLALEDERIRISGPVVALGYTGGARFDGTYLTSDLGRWSADARLEVLGRADDVIVTGGEKVAPALVEAALAQLPGVAECAVLGRPDPEWGQRVVAVVVLASSSGRITVEDIRSTLRDQLPPHALPRELVVVEALPLRGPGKTDRRALAGMIGVSDDEGAE